MLKLANQRVAGPKGSRGILRCSGLPGVHHPAQLGQSCGGKARQDPCRRTGTNCVILGPVQSYGGQKLSAGRGWDLRGLADKLFVALYWSRRILCVFPQCIFGHKGIIGLLYLMSPSWKTCDLILTILGVIYIALETSASSVLVMLVFKRYFLRCRKWDDSTVVLLCRVTTDNFMPQACILRADSAEKKNKAAEKKI